MGVKEEHWLETSLGVCRDKNFEKNAYRVNFKEHLQKPPPDTFYKKSCS